MRRRTGRDGRQGWSREAEKAWNRIFGEPQPKKSFSDTYQEALEKGVQERQSEIIKPRRRCDRVRLGGTCYCTGECR